jgi:hypothetical protein
MLCAAPALTRPVHSSVCSTSLFLARSITYAPAALTRWHGGGSQGSCIGRFAPSGVEIGQDGCQDSAS